MHHQIQCDVGFMRFVLSLICVRFFFYLVFVLFRLTKISKRQKSELEIARMHQKNENFKIQKSIFVSNEKKIDVDARSAQTKTQK